MLLLLVINLIVAKGHMSYAKYCEMTQRNLECDAIELNYDTKGHTPVETYQSCSIDHD